MRSKVLVIVGPTASGKSGLAVKIAREIEREKPGGYAGAEVISADSRQVYRGLDIGTGKITHREMRGVRHHLLDVADPRRAFSVEKYRTLANHAIADIVSRGKLPIITGGTGFYIDMLVNGIDLPPIGADPKLRARLEERSPAQLMALLRRLDCKRWNDINKNPSDKKNARRIIRAIEIAYVTRQKAKGMAEGCVSPYISAGPARDRASALTTAPCRNKYAHIFIGIQLPPDELRRRIHKRLLARIKSGMIAEASHLHAPRSARNPNGGLSWKRMEELGLEYRYLARHLQGKLSRAEFIAELESAIWQYARRQMTWWRRNRNIHWVHAPLNIPRLPLRALTTGL